MITKKCIVCGAEQSINVSSQEMRLWNLGMHIQEAMPNLTENERELLLSGMCGSCYDEICAEEEEVSESEDDD